MSAETLRRAAALMRERAEGADVGPWVSVAQSSHADWYGLQSPFFALGSVFDRENATHLASWHPAVALAVADWLDFAAARDPYFAPAGYRHALKVAHAYLGETQDVLDFGEPA